MQAKIENGRVEITPGGLKPTLLHQKTVALGWAVLPIGFVFVGKTAHTTKKVKQKLP
jgi:hypothetical protein